jgi:hypothetical protein
VFEHSIPLDVQAVVKLAPAVHRERRGLGIRAEGSQALAIWGLTPIAPTALCVDVKGPGLLVVKGLLRNVMIYHPGEVTFLEDEEVVARLVWKSKMAHSSGCWKWLTHSRPPGQAATGGMMV